MSRRASPELFVAGLLLLAVGALVAIRAAAPPRAARDPLAAVLHRTDRAGLACLKRAVEGSPQHTVRLAPEPTSSQIGRLADRIEAVRELRFEDVPVPRFISATEMSRRAAEDAYLDHEDLLRDELILRAFGAIERGADLALLGGGDPLGIYDPNTGEVLVVDDVGSLEHTTTHELAHALTDQAIGFPVAEATPRDWDEEDQALAALIEGDATFAASLLSPRSAFENIAALVAIPFIGGRDAPHLVVREGMFPYVEGLAFVCTLWERGGWDAVDAAYARPPATTDQVLFPRRYLAGERSEDPRDPERLEGWTAPATEPWGASSLLFLFEAPGGRVASALDAPRGRAAAWGGGEVHVMLNDDEHAIALTLVQRPGERSLCRSVDAWYRATFPDDRDAATAAGERMARIGRRQAASLRCPGREVRLGIGPDLRVARRLSV